jgi:hypothetical protein
MGRVGGRALLALLVAAALAGCSVVPLPASTALRGQGAREHEWDVQNCQAEAAYQAHYSPTDSPLANWFQKVFFWGTAGASLGGLITGFPSVVASSGASTAGSQATEGLIAGAGAGGITGTLDSVSGHERFARAWGECMSAHGYAVGADHDRAGLPAAPTP